MVAGAPESESLRALFTELEFTTLLKELVPTLELKETDYRELQQKDLKPLSQARPLAIAFELTTAATVSRQEEEELQDESGNLPLIPPALAVGTIVAPLKLALSPEAGKSFTAHVNGDELSAGLKELLQDAKAPKSVHDYKAALRELGPRGIALAGVVHDPMLYSYLIHPVYSNHSLPEIAVRSFNLKLSNSLAESADVTGRITSVLRKEVEDAGLLKIYEDIDLPLAPVLARMELAGVKIDCDMLSKLSVELEKQCDAKGREIRAAFIAEPGHVLLSADYSQIELRLLAHFSDDPLLVEAFRRGDDIHALTASQVFGVPPMLIDAEHRRRAKAVNFGIVYGLSPFGLAQQLGIEQREARKFIDAYFEKYSGVRQYIDRVVEETRREQKVKTLFGRTRPIPDINSKNANMRGFAERTAVNTPLQGTAADLIKLAMIQIDEELRSRKLKSRMLLQVHDELLFEVPEAELDTMRSLVRDRMENVYALKVPLLAEACSGLNWRDVE